MPKQLTTEMFIEKAKKIHGDKYNYDQVEYVNSHSPVKIFCNRCNKYFYQIPNNHLTGMGCKSCGIETVKNKLHLTYSQFIKKAQEVHGNKYNYESNTYVDTYHKTLIICKKCGIHFLQTPASHLAGHGCKKCAIKNNAFKITKTKQHFLEKAKKYNLLSNFKFLEYIDTHHKVKVFCNKCKKIFFSLPSNLFKGKGCPYCAKQRIFYNQGTTETFIKKAKSLHGTRYEYSQVIYKNNHVKVKIFCNKCKNYFMQAPNTHLNGSGCPHCKQSKGELQIANFLNIHNIKYYTQKRFENCRNKRLLPFDFYLPDYNMCVEFQGKQHYIDNTKFDKYDLDFKQRQIRDQIKRDYCKEQNIKLLEIRYDENIEEILKRNLYIKGEGNI